MPSDCRSAIRHAAVYATHRRGRGGRESKSYPAGRSGMPGGRLDVPVASDRHVAGRWKPIFGRRLAIWAWARDEGSDLESAPAQVAERPRAKLMRSAHRGRSSIPIGGAARDAGSLSPRGLDGAKIGRGGSAYPNPDEARGRHGDPTRNGNPGSKGMGRGYRQFGANNAKRPPPRSEVVAAIREWTGLAV